MLKFNGDVKSFFSEICNATFKTAEDLHDCINPLLYEQDDLILESHIYDFEWKNSSTFNIEFEPFVTALGFGQCFVAKNIGVLGASKMIKVNINSTLDYKIWVHDPDFFLESYFPGLIPGSDFIFPAQEKKNLGAWTFYEAEEYNLLNRDASPCTNYKEQSSSFTKCTVKQIIRRTNCKVPGHSRV